MDDSNFIELSQLRNCELGRFLLNHVYVYLNTTLTCVVVHTVNEVP